jgi:hypothetical protein
MKKLVMAAVAMMVLAVVAVPSAVAQETEKMDKTEKMEKMGQQSHMMKGTMTAPDEEAVEIGYVLAKGEYGPEGWIVVEEDGEKTKIEMRDLSMDGDYVNYNWSPPDNADLVITCSLKKQSDGGFAGNCKDNEEERRTGQMTMAPMGEMNPCAAQMNRCGANPCAAEANPCSG